MTQILEIFIDGIYSPLISFRRLNLCWLIQPTGTLRFHMKSGFLVFSQNTRRHRKNCKFNSQPSGDDNVFDFLIFVL